MTPRYRVRRLLLPLLLLPALTAAVPGTGVAAPDDATAPRKAGKLFGQTPDEFASRRTAVRAAVKDAIVLVRGGSEHDDVDRVRFRTENDLMYLTGVEASDAYLVLLPDGDPSGQKEILFLPTRNPSREQWMDPVPGADAKTQEMTGIATVKDVRTLWETLKPSLEKTKSVLIVGAVGKPASYTPNGSLEARIHELAPEAVVGRADRFINTLRYRKSPGEIANLRGAIAATNEGHVNAAHLIRPGVTEIAVEGVILAGFRKGGAPREGFPCIVGGGSNSTVLHHFAGERQIQPNEVVVVDIGAEYNYYSADITRTYPSSGKFTQRQRELYQLVLDTQRACEKQVVPGKTTLRELDAFARDFLRKSPLRAAGADGQMVTMDRFFVHALGHSLGMDVHDVMAGTNVLQTGVVFTIEPGIYIASEKIGIRIEDDYLVTETGVEKLSGALPCEVKEIEAMMKGVTPKPVKAGARPARQTAGR